MVALKKFGILLLLTSLIFQYCLIQPSPVYGRDPDQPADNVTRLFWHESTKLPDLLKGNAATASVLGLSSEEGKNPERTAQAFLRVHKSALGMDESAGQWAPVHTSIDKLGTSHVRLKQQYKGLPVVASELVVHVAESRVVAVNGQYPTSIQVSTTPKLTADEAYKVATSKLLKFSKPVLKSNELVIVNPSLLNPQFKSEGHLAYMLVIENQTPPDSLTVFIDAQTGTGLFSYSTWPDARNRQIYDLNGSTTLPGTQVYNESGPIGSPSADATNAYTFTGNTYDYYFSTFGRDSFNNSGAMLTASVRYGTMGNAFWNGSQTVYGPGYAVKDVVAHEWTHGVTQYTANLVYLNQQGALNEAISDIFACMVDRDDWLCGEDLPGGAIRNLSNPSAFGHPGKVSEYLITSSDNGGVHTNSLIPSHGAYLMAEGGTYNGRTITGIGRGPTELIFYRALTVYLTSGSTFNQAYSALLSACSDLYGSGSANYANCMAALQAVELDQPVPSSYPPDSYEPDDSYSQASTITVNGDAQNHSFHQAYDSDWSKFVATAGTQYYIETLDLGSNCDTYLYLYDTNGTTPITSDDDGGPGLASLIVWTAPANGIYYVRACHWRGGTYGSGTDYRLRVVKTPQKFMGADSATIAGYCPAGNFILTKFTATTTGYLTHFRIQSDGTGQVKLALYSDNSGEPGTLISSLNYPVLLDVSGTHLVPFTNTAVTAGTNYWMAFNSSTSIIGYSGLTGTYRYKAASYSAFTFPSSAGTGFASSPAYSLTVAGWGVISSAGIQKLLGANDVAIASTHSAISFIFFSPWTATTTGSLSQIRVKCNATGSVKAAIYADSSGNPGTLLNANNTGITVNSGWNTITIPSTTVNAGTTYWLAFNQNAWCVGKGLSELQWRYKSNPYSSDFPNPAGAVTSYSGTYTIIAGWGYTGTPPAVTTNAASSITATGATLNGNLTSLGSDSSVDVYFEYDTSTSYGTSTSTQPRSSIGTFNQAISSLTPGTLYRYRAVAAGTETANGSDSTFTTSAVAPTVTNGPGASNITSTAARLNGNLTATGGENPTVHIYWGTTDGGTTPASWANDNNLGTTVTGTFYSDISSLTSNTPYYYRCRAINSAGGSWASSTATFTTLAAPQKLLGANDVDIAYTHSARSFIFFSPWTATATGSLSQIRVKCSATGNVKAAIYTDSSGNPGTLLNANNTGITVYSGWNTITIPSTPVNAGTTYWLAFNQDAACVGQGTSDLQWRYKSNPYSSDFPNPAGAVTSYSGKYTIIAGWGTTIPPTPPSAPNLLSPGASVTFIWDAPTGATKYRLQVNTTAAFDGTSMFDQELGNVTSREVTGLSLGTTYYWRVRAGNDGGWSAWSSIRSIVTNTAP